MEKFKIAKKILRKIERSGFEAYIVGGYPRDQVMKREEFGDIDISTSALPDDIENLFEDTIDIGKKYGTIAVRESGVLFEITTFRTESDYIDGRRPNKIEFTDDVIADLNRRDFTINTLLLNSQEEIVDYINGFQDINKKIIRSINDPQKTFEDDALRILRACRFVSQLGFSVENGTKNAMIKNAENIYNISHERIRKELDLIFLGNSKKQALKLLIKLDLDLFTGVKDINLLHDDVNLLTCYSLMKHHDKIGLNKKEFKKVEIVKSLISKELKLYDIYLNEEDVISSVNSINNIIFNKAVNLEDMYESLVIKDFHDVDITGKEIEALVPVKDYIKAVKSTIEKSIIDGNLENNNSIIKEFILELDIPNQ